MNSELVDVAEETVTLAPVALRVPGRLLLVPTTTLPKFSVVGVRVTWAAEVPLPDREIVRFELGAFERMAMLPLTLPLDFGEKAVLNV